MNYRLYEVSELVPHMKVVLPLTTTYRISTDERLIELLAFLSKNHLTYPTKGRPLIIHLAELRSGIHHMFDYFY